MARISDTNGAARKRGKSESEDDMERVALHADWDDISAGLRKDLGHQLHSQWIKPIQLGEFDAATGTLQLFLPSEFAAEWVRKHFADRLSLAWKIMRSEIKNVAIDVHPSRKRMADISLGDSRRPANDGPDLRVVSDGNLGDPGFSSVGLDASLTFAAFVTGDANVLARNAAQRMAANGLRADCAMRSSFRCTGRSIRQGSAPRSVAIRMAAAGSCSRPRLPKPR